VSINRAIVCPSAAGVFFDALDPTARAARRRVLLAVRLAVFDIAMAAILAALVYVVLHASRQAASAQTNAVADDLAAVGKLDVKG
jgi:hypothetical protein